MTCTLPRLGFIETQARNWERLLERLSVKCRADFTGATVVLTDTIITGLPSEGVLLAADQAIGDSTATTLAPWSVGQKGAHSDGNFDLTTGIFTAPTAGIYHVSGSVSWKEAAPNNLGQRTVRVRIRDFATTLISNAQQLSAQPAANLAFNTVQLFDCSIQLQADDQIFLQVEQDSGAVISVEAIDQGTYLNIWKIG